jgi:hypothetical protein
MIGAMVATAAVAQAQDRTLVIYLQGMDCVGLLNMSFAENTTDRILAEAGIRVQWKKGRPQSVDHGTLTVVFEHSAPAGVSDRALAYALPFREGAAIHVLYRRVAAAGSKELLPVILGHVLAHEIGHVLRRNDGHEPSGVMKAHWSLADLKAMSVKPYSFTPADLELIRDYWTVRSAAVVR